MMSNPFTFIVNFGIIGLSAKFCWLIFVSTCGLRVFGELVIVLISFFLSFSTFLPSLVLVSQFIATVLKVSVDLFKSLWD